MTAFFQFIACLFQPWTWRMAWRDSRRSRGRLVVYASSIILGIASLTAISSFGIQMRQVMANEAKSLLGADLVVVSRDPLTPEQNGFLTRLGGEQSRETAFGSMVVFPKSGDTRLVQVRAIDGGFPFYGGIEATPAGAVAEWRAGRGALVEQGLMEFFGAKVGDPVKVGEVTLPIAGTLTGVPGETMAMGSIAPRVFVPMARVAESGLLGQGSLASYKVYFRLPDAVDVEALVERHRGSFRALKLRFDTVEERKQDLGRGLDQLLKFLNLAGFTALLLGGVGVAAGIHAHMRRKVTEVAVLRCLGAQVPQAFAVYFAQAVALGVVGACGGALLGIGAQFGLQAGLADFLPARVPVAVSPAAVALGMVAGFVICLFFALLPLLPLRRVPPLAALRTQAGGGVSTLRDPLAWLLFAVAGGGLVAFGVSQSGDWRTGAGYAGGVAAALGVLAGVAWVLSRLARVLVPARWPFVVRQGFGNLHRPDNRTVLMMQSLGIGVFLVLTMVLIQASLSGGLEPLEDGTGGNAVLFDIQSDQRDGVLEILRGQDLPVIEDAPMISMRLHSVKGVSVEALRRDQGRGGRMYGREYRSTYREALSPTETLVAGEWVPRVESLDAPVPVSMEVDLAQRLQLGLGDPLVFDVQGILVDCVVGSLREVDWRRLSPNFFVVFPAGAIEAAPAVHAMVTRVGDDAASARMQREVVGRFPNVSAVDLTLVLRTIDGIFSKISEVVRFMALFTVGTGLLVLAGTIASGRQQRVRESILLRTLGATRGQIRGVLVVEYLVLGVLAALNGILLANLAAWAAGRWVFKTPYEWRPLPAAIALAVVALVTLAAGLLGNRRVLNRPPLEVLREEN